MAPLLVRVCPAFCSCLICHCVVLDWSFLIVDKFSNGVDFCVEVGAVHLFGSSVYDCSVFNIVRFDNILLPACVAPCYFLFFCSHLGCVCALAEFSLVQMGLLLEGSSARPKAIKKVPRAPVFWNLWSQHNRDRSSRLLILSDLPISVHVLHA